MKFDAGVTLNTPQLSELMTGRFLEDYCADQDKYTFENDWEKEEASPCPMCNGTGKNMNHLSDPYCINCDGTGMEFKWVYGVKSKQGYAFTVEYGIEAKKEYCKAMREAFEEVRAAGKVSELQMFKPFALPKTIEMEMLARGYPIKQMQEAGEIRALTNIIAKEFPDFLCTPYKKF